MATPPSWIQALHPTISDGETEAPPAPVLEFPGATVTSTPGKVSVGVASATTALAATTLPDIVALHTTDDGKVTPAANELRVRPFVGVNKAVATSDSSVGVQVGGPLSRDVLNLGAGVACAVGVDVNGVPVRSTDPDCVSAPNWLGFCDTDGTITIAPLRRDFFDVRDFGAIADFVYNDPDNATDNLAAFDACMAAAAVLSVGPPLIAQDVEIRAPGSYYLSNTWHFTHTVRFCGSGNNGNEQAVPGTMLAFPKNVTGIYIHADGDGFGYQAGRSTVRDCVVYNKDLPTSDFAPQADPDWTGVGIYASATCYLRNVLVQGFGCKDTNTGRVNIGGISLIANAGPRDPPPLGPLKFIGNADASVISECHVANSGGHGIFLAGNDANAIKVTACEMTNNMGWGVYDVGGGSHFIGCIGQANGGNFAIEGSIAMGSSDLEVANTFIGLQVEEIQFPFIVGQDIIIPGLDNGGLRTVTAVDVSADPALITVDSPADVTENDVTVIGGKQVDLANHDYKAGDTFHVAFTVSAFLACYSEGSGAGPGIVNDVIGPSMVIGGLLAQSNMYATSALVLNNADLTNAALNYRNSRGAVPIITTLGEPSSSQRGWSASSLDPNHYVSFDYSNALLVWGFSRDGLGADFMLGIPNGGSAHDVPLFRPGLKIQDIDNAGAYSKQTAGTAAPTTGAHVQGDIHWNTGASAGGKVGWVCTASGTPGTWKPFGAIDP